MENSDYLIRGVLKTLNARFTFAETTSTITEGVMVHDTDPVASYLFGKALMAGALVSPLLEGSEKYSLRWDYEGEVNTIIVDINAECDVRGIPYVPHIVDLVDNEADVYGNTGNISVVKSSEGKILSSGVSEAGLLDIADDLGFYFSVSDQIETEFSSVIEFNPDPKRPIKIAAGFMLQAMPGCDLENFDIIRNKMNTALFEKLLKTEMPEERKLWSLLEYLFEGTKEETQIKDHSDILYGFSHTPEYKCLCNHKKMEEAIRVLSKEEIEESFKSKESLQIKCQFCQKTYVFTEKELL